MPSQTLLPNPSSTDAVVNLLHLKLFHHFQTYTQQTLLLPPEFWGYALQLCFQYDYLMNAILCVAARHLTTLQPEDATYPIAAACQLSRALSRFRDELSNISTSNRLDAFIATSVLLQYEVWSSTDFVSPQDDSEVLFGKIDVLFPMLCRGPFASMIQQSDPHALLLLYHFYRAVRILLPADEYWWAYNRAALSETVLKEWLTKKSAKCADAFC